MSPSARLLSALEATLAVAIVLGHNLLHVLPNEVPILLVLGLLSLRVRDGGFAVLGLRRVPAWGRVVVIAVLAAALRIALGDLVIDPLTSQYWPPAAAPAGADTLTGDPLRALLVLLFVWVFAAFGEEFGYHGYLLTRIADIGRRSPTAWRLGVVLVAVVFGLGHAYKGPAGVIDSGVAGLILGAAYLASGRTLWTCILAHGLIDTVAVVLVYLGVDT